MRKLFVFMLAAAMAFSFVGTAMAQDTVELRNIINDANMTVYWPLVYSDTQRTTDTGASAYLVTNDLYLEQYNPTGTTVFGISNERTNAAGTEMRAVQLTDLAVNALAGTTPIGPPQLLTGTTSTMIVYVVSSVPVANTAATGGATLYRIDGGSGQIISAGVPFNGKAVPAGSIFNFDPDPWSLAPVTLEWDEATSAASIFGVSSSSAVYAGATGGVSVWRRSSATLGLPTATGQTTFNVASGVKQAYAAPVISGNSLFVVATNYWGGVSVFQFYKQDLTAGGNNIYGAAINTAGVIEPHSAWHDDATVTGVSPALVTPTPAAQSGDARTGGTLYVTDWTGGVTLYSTQNLAQLNAYGFVKSRSGVTAAPAATSNRLLLPWTSSVSCFATNPGTERVRGASGVSLIWQYDFDEALGVRNDRYQIWASPIISNGYAWVTVIDEDSPTNDTTIYRFAMNDTFNGDPEIVSTEPLMFHGPIVVGDYDANDDNENGYLWYCSNNPTVDRINQSRWAEASEFWTQFKADAAKTGENTIPERDDDEDDLGDSSGCFLSTIK